MLLAITLEANDRFRDYSSFGRSLGTLGESLQVLRQTWLLHPTTPDFQRVLAVLMQNVNSGSDRIFVADVTGRPLNGWMSRTNWEWANQHNN